MITILLAAYNGEKYIGEQIESIMNQTCTDWELIVQDDCSTDTTMDIVTRYSRMHPDKITVLENENNSGSAAKNFISMLPFAKGSYVMFSDDDDVWLPDKISITLDKMHELESGGAADRPLLVHTDLEVVDIRLNRIAASLFSIQNLNYRNCQLNHLLVQNIVTGCTMMVNRCLVDMVASFPERAIMHDWWFAMIAAAFGEIGFVKKPTAQYRQHEANLVGAKNAKNFRYFWKRLFSVAQTRKELSDTYAQAEEFAKLFADALNLSAANMIREYASIPSKTKVKRVWILFRCHFWKSGFLRKCGQIFSI